MIALPNPELLSFVRTTYAHQHLGLKPSTLAQYATTVRRLQAFASARGYCAGPLTVRDLREELCGAFLRCTLESGRAAATVNARRRDLGAIWRFAFAQGLADEPALPGKIKEPKRLPKAWRLEQMEALLAACYLEPSRRGWEGGHWAALVLVIYDTGLRISAALSLRTRQLDLARGALTVEAEQQKDGEEMEFGLHPQTVAALIDALSGCDADLLFPWPFAKRKIWAAFGRILGRAGLPETRRDKFHRIRRTSASWLESVRPGAAQEHLGHGDRATTARYIDRQIAGTAINAAAILPRFAVARRIDPQRLLF